MCKDPTIFFGIKKSAQNFRYLSRMTFF